MLSDSGIVGASERERLFDEARDRINQCHREFLKSGEGIGNALLAAANYRREAGALLETLKTATYAADGKDFKVVPHGEWEKLFAPERAGKNGSGSVFDFSPSTARNYIQFAKKHPEPITDLKQIVQDGKTMLLDAGLIELEQSTPNPNPLKNAFVFADKLRQAFNQNFVNGCLTREKVEEWEPEYRSSVKETLRPIADFYDTL